MRLSVAPAYQPIVLPYQAYAPAPLPGLCPNGERDHHPATLAASVRLTLASWSRGFPPGHASSSAASSGESRAFLLIRVF